MTDYKSAGVDTEAGERAVQLLKSAIKSTFNKNVIGDFGGFAGLFDISEIKKYKHPILTTSTDGVGTKIKIAQALDIHDTIGIDLVAMVINDLIVTGAKPLFLTDYIAIGKVIPEKVEQIVKGIVKGCVEAECALIGGETAEHPGVMAEEDYDLAAAGVGVVEKDELLSSENVEAGDIIYALPSSGLHSNGFSLVRKIISNSNLEKTPSDFANTLGETLLTPTKIYVKDVLRYRERLKSVAHITGSGIAANVARAIPNHLHAVINRSSWSIPVIYSYLQKQSQSDFFELEKVFNMGLGMVLISNKPLDFTVIGEIQKSNSSSQVNVSPKGGIGGTCELQGSYSV